MHNNQQVFMKKNFEIEYINCSVLDLIILYSHMNVKVYNSTIKKNQYQI
jgi:hypothetical protein